MVKLRAWWYGSWNPWFLIHTYQFKDVLPDTELEVAAADHRSWKRTGRHENAAPAISFIMHVLALLAWIPHVVMVTVRFFFYTAYLPKSHPFIKRLDHNKEVVAAKQYTNDGDYY